MAEELTSLVSSTSLEHRLDETFKCLASMNGVSINVVSTIASFLQMHMGRVNASATLFGAKIPYCCDFTNNLLSHVDVCKLGYVSLEVAIEMASKAQLENVNILLQETKDFSQFQNKTFIGIGCTAAIRSEKPKKGPHRAFVSLKIGSKIFVLHLDMKKDFRDRDQEDVVASYVMVIGLQRALGIPELPTEHFLYAEEKIELVAETEDDPLKGLFLEGSNVESVLFTGTVKPCVFHNVSLPSGTLVYPGSYNPIHEGHVRLALAAQEKYTYQDKEGNEKLSPLVFEISVMNPDKPRLTIEECYHRLHLILEMTDERNLENVAVIFTRVPKFLDKSKLFKGCRFLIGHDTMTRILDQKYYDSETSVLSVLIEIVSANNCSFLVGGRHDENDKFHTLTTDYLEKNLGMSSLACLWFQTFIYRT